MEASDLDQADAVFVAIFDCETAIAMGALKRLSDGSGELKSMHVAEARRGSGLADAILNALLDRARREGMARLSLKTGSQPVFAAARAFYERHGFAYCPPFEGYSEDPHSVFMTRAI